MKVKFLETSIVKAQGVIVDKFEEGKEYDLPVDSARRWIRRNLAVEVKQKVVKPKPPVPKVEKTPDVQVELDLGLDEEKSDPTKPDVSKTTGK